MILTIVAIWTVSQILSPQDAERRAWNNGAVMVFDQIAPTPLNLGRSLREGITPQSER